RRAGEGQLCRQPLVQQRRGTGRAGQPGGRHGQRRRHAAQRATAGQLAGDAGQVTHFGFSVQAGASPSGDVSLLVRKGAGVGSNLYQVQGTSLSAQSTIANSAVILVSGTIRVITDPSHPLPMDGSVTIRLSAQDNGAGGAADTVGILVRKSNGNVWLNSNFT